MPYISQSARDSYEEEIIKLSDKLHLKDFGHLTYVLYALAMRYATGILHSPRYADYSVAIAALTDAAHEMRRRKLDPHEDRMRAENGDI